jgi:hypothetical protein
MVLMSLGEGANIPELLEDHVPPMGDLGYTPGYSHLHLEYFREHQSQYDCFAANQAGVFLEGDPGDDSSRYFNVYPPFSPLTIPWEMNYTIEPTLVDSPVGPSSLAPASSQPLPLPLPLPLPSPSTTNSHRQKLYNCTHCGTFFDRYSRARDCRNMDLGLTPHGCLGKCEIVGW